MFKNIENILVKISRNDTIDLSLYEQIINRYTELAKNTTNQASSINNMIFVSNLNYYTDLYNTIVDIDKNEISELLISIGTSEGAYIFLYMYTISLENNKLIRLTTENNRLNNLEKE